jgi:hypothetical protein
MIDKEDVSFKNGTLKGLHREYLLTDGTTITPQQLMDKLNMSYAGAKGRLDKYDNPIKLFRPSSRKITSPRKKYVKKPKQTKRGGWGGITPERIAKQPMQDPMYILMMKKI